MNAKKKLELAKELLGEYLPNKPHNKAPERAIVRDALKLYVANLEAANAEVEEWIETGELTEDAVNVPCILAEAGDLLDHACSHDILGGGILFKGKDGKYYTVTVEAVVGEASRSFVKDTLAEQAEG